MERRNFLRAMAGSFAATHIGSAATVGRPNVLLIIADDMGWGDLRSHGNAKIDTPVLDKLRSEGARFERFYVSPLCAPTRASLLTGRYYLRTGTTWVTRGLETMRSEEVTLAEVLKQAGYATGCFGKWHNGAHYPCNPLGQGFDEFLGFCAGHWNNYFDTKLERNGTEVRTHGYITDVLTDGAIEFMEKNRNRPFFCYVPYNAPHSPFQVPDRYFDKYKARGLDDVTACVYGMVENLDENVGRLLAALERFGLSERTIVIFTSDNGPNSNRYNGGMRARKGSLHEGGMRVPLFIRWPGRIEPGRTVDRIAAHIDILPTIVELCGLAKVRTLPLDGISLAPLLRGVAATWPERMLFENKPYRGRVGHEPGAVRTDRYLLIIERKARRSLFDLVADPGEKLDIARQKPEVVRRLAGAYDRWFEDVTRRGFERPPIPIGYPQAKRVELPAPEAYMHGNLRYKGRMGWANDWITNWRSLEDYVEWDVEVVRDGLYRITLLYTCPQGDVGAKVRVEAGDSAVEGVVGRAHDPPPVPSPDRVPRKEVYEKEWGRLELGRLRLRRGRQRLRVRALAKPGDAVMDLKAVWVQWVE